MDSRLKKSPPNNLKTQHLTITQIRLPWVHQMSIGFPFLHGGGTSNPCRLMREFQLKLKHDVFFLSVNRWSCERSGSGLVSGRIRNLFL